MECTQEQTDHLRRASSLLKLTPARRPRQCEHIKTNGEFCGSPALRGRNYCYFHLTHIGRRLRTARNHARVQASSPENAVVPLELPPFEDANSIQTALMQVVGALLHNRIDSKRAGLVLYALQTASSNLNNGADFAQDTAATVAGRYDDFEEDFELGEDAPELKTDAAEETSKDQEYATAMQMEQVVEACARLEEAKKEAEAAGDIKPEEDRTDESERNEYLSEECGTEGFCCDPVKRFLCGLMGPIAQARTPDAPQRYEREAASQRLALQPPTLSPAEREKDGAPAPSQEKEELAA